MPQDLKIADLKFGRKWVIVSKEASLFELIDKSVWEAHLNIEKNEHLPASNLHFLLYLLFNILTDT